MASIRTFFDGILDVITSFFVKILYMFNWYVILRKRRQLICRPFFCDLPFILCTAVFASCRFSLVQQFRFIHPERVVIRSLHPSAAPRARRRRFPGDAAAGRAFVLVPAEQIRVFDPMGCFHTLHLNNCSNCYYNCSFCESVYHHVLKKANFAVRIMGL